MNTRNVEISFEQARNWYKSSNKELRSLVLQAYTEEELAEPSYLDIRSFEDACNAFRMDIQTTNSIASKIKEYVGSSAAALFKLRIIVKALNARNYISFTDEPEEDYLFYPRIGLTTDNSSDLLKLGIVKHNNQEYFATSIIDVCSNDLYGAGRFTSDKTEAHPNMDTSFLCCANEDIAEYLAAQFGMLIVTALCGDFVDDIIYPEQS